jgi:hypothetical protein
MPQLDPMEADEVEPYMLHRLSCVGWTGTPRFTGDALAAMYRWSGGNPRRINQLAGRVLLYGAVERVETFGGDALALVIADLDRDTPRSSYIPKARAPLAEPPVETAKAAAEEEPYELCELAPLAAEISAVVEARRSILRDTAQPKFQVVAPAPAPAPEPVAEPVITLAPEPAVEATAEPEADPVEADAPVLSTDPMVRIVALEAQVRQQDEALRRVLTLLVDWVETNDASRRPDLSTLRGNAA